MLQDFFSSGAIKSATDFQVYKEVAGLSGLDFAYTDNSAVYHTKVFHFIFYFFNFIWNSSFLLFTTVHRFFFLQFWSNGRIKTVTTKDGYVWWSTFLQPFANLIWSDVIVLKGLTFTAQSFDLTLDFDFNHAMACLGVFGRRGEGGGGVGGVRCMEILERRMLA